MWHAMHIPETSQSPWFNCHGSPWPNALSLHLPAALSYRLNLGSLNPLIMVSQRGFSEWLIHMNLLASAEVTQREKRPNICQADSNKGNTLIHSINFCLSFWAAHSSMIYCHISSRRPGEGSNGIEKSWKSLKMWGFLLTTQKGSWKHSPVIIPPPTSDTCCRRQSSQLCPGLDAF